MHLDLPFLSRSTSATGKRYTYYRRGGRATPIRSLEGKRLSPGEPGFLDAYAAIHATFGDKVAATAPVPEVRSVESLVRRYLESDDFAAKAPATQREYRAVSGAIVKQIGGKSVAAIELPHVLAMRERFGGRKTPRKANKAVAMLSILMEFARGLGWRKDNPALRPKKLATGDGYLPWTADEVATFLAHPSVGEPLKRVVALAYWTGLRGGDLVEVRQEDRRAGAIHVTATNKTGAAAYIPEDAMLTAILDAAPLSDKSPMLLTRADEATWTLDDLRHKITAAVKEVGLRPGLSLHGLRKALHSALAEQGATDAEIEAVVPHADPNMTRHYRKGANQKVLAKAAMTKLAGRAA